MRVEKNKVVDIHYVLRLSNGEEVDTTDDEAPLPYLHGYGNIVPGLERALEGREQGDKFTVEVAPEDGYGAYDESATEEIPVDEFPEEMEIVEGDEIYVEDEEGNEVVGYIEEIDEENGTILVDYNHPLAGETLIFDVEVAAVRDATPDELQQGYANDPYAEDDEDEHDHDHGNGNYN